MYLKLFSAEHPKLKPHLSAYIVVSISRIMPAVASVSVDIDFEKFYKKLWLHNVEYQAPFQKPRSGSFIAKTCTKYTAVPFSLNNHWDKSWSLAVSMYLLTL